ncbi:hypothetical protein [Prosthecomicrobium sp. N25]|uniref:hypothetical protein n=1 Tax=Prosthecomicrobium sp. N25 TaxID=3129254 RepID=UPI003076FD7A
MCDCAEETDGDEGEAVPVEADVLMARARAVEAGRPGERVPDALWPVFFGLTSGTIPWRHHLRMVDCRRTALGFLALEPARAGGGRRPGPICTACDAA